jgi:pimeloyl-ACP methyl ester carboxylesterase
MSRLLLCIFAMALSACQGVPHPPTDRIEVKHMRVDGTDLAYVEEGNGTTIVMVHGAVGDWRTWEAERPYLATKYHYVAYSRRYHFPNVWVDDGQNYWVMQHVEDLAALIRALNAGPVHLVGGSYGGAVAGRLTLKYPDLVRSLVMSEPSIIRAATLKDQGAWDAFVAGFNASKAASRAGNVRESAVLFFDAVSDEQGAYDRAPPMRQQRWMDNANTIAPFFAEPAAPPVTCAQLRTIRVPVMVMQGERSRALSQSNETLLSCLPEGTAIVVVPEAPHMWYPVNPQAGAKAILAFIDQH